MARVFSNNFYYICHTAVVVLMVLLNNPISQRANMFSVDNVAEENMNWSWRESGYNGGKVVFL